MIEQTSAQFGRLAFDRDAIVRAALRAYIEASLYGIARFGSPALEFWTTWVGDLERGALSHFRDSNGVVLAWTKAGIVGLAYDFGSGPIEQLGLSPDAVTGGPDDVRGAVAGLPDELEPALVLATSMLGASGPYGERDAGVGFWLYGDRFGGTFFLFQDRCRAWGANQLAAWGLLRKGRLLQLSCTSHPRPGELVVNHARPQDAPAHAIMDAVVDRRLKGPTEFTPAELETLLHPALDPKRVLDVQRTLAQVGITWPGSPELPPHTPQPWINGFTAQEYVGPPQLTQYFGPIVFNQTTILRAALRAYIESILAPLDPLARHTLIPCIVPKWTGDLQRGAFYNGNGCGDYDVIAWTEAGIVGLAYKRGAASLTQLSAALPGLPDELLPALDIAESLLDEGTHGEKLATIGFWLHGEHTGGTLFDDPTLPGARRLAAWGALDRSVPWGTQDKTGEGRLPMLGDRHIAALAIMLARTTASPIHALLDAVVDRRLHGPTELLADELATLFPTPLSTEERFFAQSMLQKAGIGWPFAPEIPEAPRRTIRNAFLTSSTAVARCHPLGYLVFDRDSIVRAALRAYVEVTLAYLDPRQCHPIPPDCGRTWTGDLRQGALVGDVTVAWNEAGVVGIVFKSFWRAPESVPEGLVAPNPDEVRSVVPDLPAQLLPALEMACSALDQRHLRRTPCVGFWLCGDRMGGTLFDTPMADGVRRLALWGRVGRGRLLPAYPHNGPSISGETFRAYAPFLAVVDAVVERALVGPTALTLDELATLFPLPPLPGPALPYQSALQKVGIAW